MTEEVVVTEAPTFERSADEILMALRSEFAEDEATRLARNALYPLSIGWAFVLGMLTVVFARWCRFHFTGMPGPDQEILVDRALIDVVLSTMMGFAIRMATDLKTPLHTSAKGIGIIVAMLCMHLLVHRFPDVWAVFFSIEWVETVIASTERHGILVFEFTR